MSRLHGSKNYTSELVIEALKRKPPKRQRAARAPAVSDEIGVAVSAIVKWWGGTIPMYAREAVAQWQGGTQPPPAADADQEGLSGIEVLDIVLRHIEALVADLRSTLRARYYYAAAAGTTTEITSS